MLPQSSPNPEQPPKQPQSPEQRPSLALRTKAKVRRMGGIVYNIWEKEVRSVPSIFALKAAPAIASFLVSMGPHAVNTVDTIFGVHMAGSMANAGTAVIHPLVEYGKEVINEVGELASSEDSPDTPPEE